MKFVIRQATEYDVEALAELAKRTFPLACPPGHTPENIADHIRRVLSVSNFTEYVTSAQCELAIASSENKLVGFALVDFRPSTDPDVLFHLAAIGPYAELSKLYVDPTFHGGGVAQALRDKALMSMREKKVQTAWLTVSQLNDRANAFYEKSGFTVIAEKKYQVGDVIDDDYLRTRAVTSFEKSYRTDSPIGLGL